LFIYLEKFSCQNCSEKEKQIDNLLSSNYKLKHELERLLEEIKVLNEEKCILSMNSNNDQFISELEKQKSHIQRNFKQVICFIEKQNYVVKESLMQKLNIEKKLVKLYQTENHKLKELNFLLIKQLNEPFNKDKTLNILQDIKLAINNNNKTALSNDNKIQTNLNDDSQTNFKKQVLSIVNQNVFTVKSEKENKCQPFLIIERGNEEMNSLFDEEKENENLCISCCENFISDEIMFSCDHKFVYCNDCYKNFIQSNKVHMKKASVNCPNCKIGEATIINKK
jgi:hypothetical protein